MEKRKEKKGKYRKEEKNGKANIVKTLLSQ